MPQSKLFPSSLLRVVWSEAEPSHVSDVRTCTTTVTESHAQEVQGRKSVSGASDSQEYCITGQNLTLQHSWPAISPWLLLN